MREVEYWVESSFGRTRLETPYDVCAQHHETTRMSLRVQYVRPRWT